ncbi:MAG: hypothetical protein JW864_12115 [Spirochaetes bacterium]|nr:hypothetical protein [Spirochaetota bacterium]
MFQNKKSVSVIILLLTVYIFSIPANGYERTGKTERDINKFRAQTTVNKLTKENLKKINLIEIISKNFGYNSYHKLKKDYWRARILVSQKKILEAKDLLELNLVEINETMRIISKDYENATQAMIDECIDKINELKFTSEMNPNVENNRKLAENLKRIKLANQQFDNAYSSYINLDYVPCITLYRNAKRHAINILQDLAEPQDRNRITDKFKIHIVDNRNEVFNES